MTTEQVAHPETARSLWVLGDQVRMMGDLAEDRLGVVDVTVQPGAGTPPHRHASPEIFLVTEGAVTFGIFGEGAPRWINAEPGAVVSIPSWLGHNYSNRSAEAARFTAIVHSEMLRFFEDVGSPDRPLPGPPSSETIDTLMAACARHRIGVLTAP